MLQSPVCLCLNVSVGVHEVAMEIAVWALSMTSSTGLWASMVEHLASPWGCNPTTAFYMCVCVYAWNSEFTVLWVSKLNLIKKCTEERNLNAFLKTSVAVHDLDRGRGNRTLGYVWKMSLRLDVCFWIRLLGVLLELMQPSKKLPHGDHEDSIWSHS